jgi:hypothetical protein
MLQKRKQPQQGPKKLIKKKKNVTKVTRTRAPVNISAQIRGSRPQMRIKRGNVIITHKEFIDDLYVSTVDDFRIIGTYPINPGLQQTFPWLSFIARNYESYKILQMTFSYESSVSTNEEGAMLMAIDYDAADPAPISKPELMSNPTMVRSNIWKNNAMLFKPRDANKIGSEKFVRVGMVAGGDIKTYDVGNLYLATSGSSLNGICGELYVSYTVELQTPQLNLADIYGSQSSRYHGTVVDKAQLFGNPLQVQVGSMPVQYVLNSIYFNLVGQYLVHMFVQGTTIANPVETIPATGIVATELFYNSNALANQAQALYRVNVTIANSYLAINATTSASIIVIDVHITNYLYSLG